MIDIQSYMTRIIEEGVTPEDLIVRAIRDLYFIERYCIDRNNCMMRDKVRITIAHVKLLYDFGQQMGLARMYLLHRIRLLEVRENDMNLEISMLRGLTPPSENLLSQLSGENEQSRNYGSLDQDKESDQEMEIILDTRIINEIDMSKAALLDISRRLEDKKCALMDIEQEVEDASKTLLNSFESGASLSFEHHTSDSSNRVERTLGPVTSKRPREGGARIMPPKHITKMDRTMEKEENVLPQGEFGVSRGRHSGEPDAARSSSDEGTVGAASASAPAEQTVTAEPNPLELVSCTYAKAIDAVQEEEMPTMKLDKKRKATISPGSEVEGDIGRMARRPNKARVIESTESPAALSSDSDDIRKKDSKTYSINESESYAESDDSPTPEARMTRSSYKGKINKADFSQLKALRQDKAGKAKDIVGSKDSKPSSFAEHFIDSVVNREVEHRESDSPKSLRSGSVYRETSDHSSDRAEMSSCFSSSKKSKNKKTDRDRVPRYQGQKSKRKAAIPIIITKEEAERDLQMSRQNWLDMDSAALGARCLDHLAELEQQRARCSNISGRVAGRMKDGKIVITEMVKAMIEKLTCVGDTFALKNENYALKEELSEIRRKEQAQSKEILSSRNMIINLQREVKSLKEGFGPFSAVVPDTSSRQENIKIVKKQLSSERKLDKQEKKDIPSFPSVQDVAGSEMEMEPLIGNTSGCSTNADYMNRDLSWPADKETAPWTDEYKKVEVNSYNKYEHNIVKSSKIGTKFKSSVIKHNRDNINDNMYNDNYNTNNKSNLESRDKKLNKDSL